MEIRETARLSFRIVRGLLAVFLFGEVETDARTSRSRRSPGRCTADGVDSRAA